MEQTLTYEESLVSKISKMTIFDQFTKTIYVDESCGSIDIESTYRELNTLKFVKTEIIYELKNHRVVSKKLNLNNLVISDLTDGNTISMGKSICKCVSSDLNKLFIQELNGFEKTVEYIFNLNKQNIIQRIFSPNTEKRLIEKFIEISNDCSWAIIPCSLSKIFYESDSIKLKKEDPDEKIIYHLGDLNGVKIFINPDDTSKKIFMGKFDSMIIIAKKYMKIFENAQGTNYNFEYLFIEQSPIKSLQVI